MSETTIAPIAGVTAGALDDMRLDPASNDPARQPEAAHRAMAAMPLGEWARRLGALPAEAYDCSWSGPYMGSTEYKRGSRAIARGQWQAPLGSSPGKPPDHGQPAAVLALVKDKPLKNEATKHDKNSVMHP
jgi:hypothetical protein